MTFLYNKFSEYFLGNFPENYHYFSGNFRKISGNFPTYNPRRRSSKSPSIVSNQIGMKFGSNCSSSSLNTHRFTESDVRMTS